MENKWLKSFVLGGVSLCLLTQPILAKAMVAPLPSQMAKVNYPKVFNQKIEEVLVCVLEAEEKLYSEEILEILPVIKYSETRTCKEIVESKPFAHNLNFNIMYGVEFGKDRIMIPQEKQEVLSILTTPLSFQTGQLKDTEELEIAMRLFVELNTDFEAEYELLRKENDILDVLFLRIRNLAYELPKGQGHPIFSEFMKDIRDSYLNVRPSKLYRAFVYYAYKNNPDKELFETLARYWVHIEEAERQSYDMEYIPDEDQSLYMSGVDQTPAPPNSDDVVFGDLENAWGEEMNEVLSEELQEDQSETIGSITNQIQEVIETTYRVEKDECLKIVQYYQGDKLIKTEESSVSKEELYRCGMAFESSTAKEEVQESEEDLLRIYYRYGTVDQTWRATKFKLNDDLDETLSYADLVSLLSDISFEHGLGSLKDKERHLFVLDGKLLILEKYKEDRLFSEINQWLKKKNIPLEIGRCPEQEEYPNIGLSDLK